MNRNIVYKNEIQKIKNFIKKNKLLIISGKNSFNKSGAKELFNFSKNKNLYLYYKKYNLPEFLEVKKLILLIKNLSQKNSIDWWRIGNGLRKSFKFFVE